MRLHLRSCVVLGGLVAVGCGDGKGGGGAGGSPGSDALDAVLGVQRRSVTVVMSDAKGIARVPATATRPATELFVVDAKTQQPIAFAQAELLEEDDGLFVRASKDDEGLEPEAVFVRKGQTAAVVPMNPSTPDVRGKVLRVSTQVFDSDFLEETDMDGVAAAAMREVRPNVIFVPAPPDGSGAAERFGVYKSSMPGTLLALRVDAATPRPADGAVVRGRARVVQTSGLRKAGVPVRGRDVAGVARTRPGEAIDAPAVSALTIGPPDATGNTMLSWGATDTGAQLSGFAVGLDTTVPDKRVAKDTRSLALSVKRGSHFACVRALFDGSDVDPQVSCVNFDAPAAPPAANLRVTVRNVPSTPVPARKPFPIDVQVENSGDEDAGPFDVTVVLSRDGRPEGGIGEVRALHIDGVRKGGMAVRRTEVEPGRDGNLYVVAQADPQALIAEGNAQDNVSRKPVSATPAGNNRAPIISVGAADNAGTVTKGRAVPLRATATDPEEGDLTAAITWTSSRDGVLGNGGELAPTGLTPGKHRIRAKVSDRGLPMVGSDLRARSSAAARLGATDPFAALIGFPVGMPIFAMEPPETVVAEFEIEVVDPVLPANSPPVVTAGPDLTSTVDGEVAPLGKASDADGDPLVLSWMAFSPTGAVVPLENPTTPRPRLVAREAGVYRLVFSASDGKADAKDEVAVTVLPASANAAPIVSVALSPQSETGKPALATVAARDPDGDGLTVSYELQRPPGSLTLIAQGESLSPSFTPDWPGVYTLKVVAEDGRGGKASAVATTVAVGTVPVVDAGTVTSGRPDAGVVGNGSSCFGGSQCASGHCAGGVCCNDDCLGLCHRCDIPGSMGTCTAVPAGQDPKDECPGQATCNGNGQCAPFLVRPGAQMIAPGADIELAGWRDPAASTGGGDDDHRACDQTGGACAYLRPNGSGSATLVVFSPSNSFAERTLGTANVNSSTIGWQNGVLLWSDPEGTLFAYRNGWSVPHLLASGGGANGGGFCEIAPDGMNAACLVNRTLAAGGEGYDVAIGKVVQGGAPLPTFAKTFFAMNDRRPGWGFSRASTQFAVLTRDAPTAIPTLLLFNLSTMAAQVVAKEAGLGGEVHVSPDGTLVAFLRNAVTKPQGMDNATIGTLAVVNVAQGTVANLASDVVGFEWVGLATDLRSLAYLQMPAAGAPSLHRVADATLPTDVLVADAVLPGGNIAVSFASARIALLRDKNMNAVPELWAGNMDGGNFGQIAEGADVQLREREAFSPGGSRLAWGFGAPQSRRLSRLNVSAPGAGPFPPSWPVGTDVMEWAWGQGEALVFAGDVASDASSSATLRVFDIATQSARVLQPGVKPHIAVVGNTALFVVQGQGASDGLYRLPIDGTVVMGACDPVMAIDGCPAGQACYARGAADAAVCAPAGTRGEGATCVIDNECAPGNTCRAGQCKRVCDIQRITCPASLVCNLIPGNARYGVCESPTMMGMGGLMGCDLFSHSICQPMEACYPIGFTGQTQCSIAGFNGPYGLCQMNGECKRGTTCWPGGPGSMCRPTCKAAVDCSAAEICQFLPQGIGGVCVPMGAPIDAAPPPPPVDAGTMGPPLDAGMAMPPDAF